MAHLAFDCKLWGETQSLEFSHKSPRTSVLNIGVFRYPKQFRLWYLGEPKAGLFTCLYSHGNIPEMLTP